ncbi:MAG: response regulator [Defluviitaleaceae bacterium]|nr:response regulator [Defluviitaleaceae bacterium]
MKKHKQSNSRLATRTRWMYMGISICTVTILLIIVGFIADGIANDASRRIARQYSIEAAGNFQAHINPHLTLMTQLAHSTTIARWMADDNNEVLRQLAFEEVIGFASQVPTSRFILAAYDTLQIYDFLPGSAEWLTVDSFVSLGQIPGGEEAQWFFDTRDGDLVFNLNIQREMAVQDLDPGTLQMWANQRVYYQGRFVGVIAIGFPFSYIFEPTFGSFDIGEMRGYIIDQYGGVRVDSAELLDTFADGLPTFPDIPEALNNPNLATHVEMHLLQRIDGIYQLSAYTFEAVPLSQGAYSFASIAPITGTDWSIIVLSYQQDIFNFDYLSLVWGIIAVLILSIIAGSIMIQQIVIQPLLRLTQSAATIGNTGELNLFGMDRQDEIGDLARTIHQAQEELKDLHIAEEKAKAKNEFLARISHEIRTPISAVLGISEIGLQTPGITKNAEESFSKIYSSGKLLLGLVNDILDFSKLEGGKMTVAEDKYNTPSLISNAVNLQFSSGSNIKFNMNIDENLPTALIGDALRIEQIIINILSNAFKYTNEGSVGLTLCSKPINADEIMLVIIIEDTGLGMTKEQIAVIFNDYTRFHEQEKSTISGTGLGMPIVANLLEIMNATIDIQSKVGVGTTVTISIPQKIGSSKVLGAEIVKKLQSFEVPTDKIIKRRTFEPMPYGKVLVVDDIETNLYVAKGLLAVYSIHVETCKSGYEAIDKIQHGNSYDIVFMDHMMPGIDGIETMKQLRRMGYSAPIIILTANALAGQENMYIKRGFDGFLSKPIMTDKLNFLLMKHIKDKQTPETIEAAKNAVEIEYIEDYRDSAYVLGKLRSDFVKNHQYFMRDLMTALDTGDIETAHINAHTLKGLAALIHEPVLSKLAEDIENLLSENLPIEDKLSPIENELNRVIESIGRVDSKGKYMEFDKFKAIALLDELRPLLESRKAESLNLLEAFRTIPEAGILVKQLENFNFKAALTSMNTLKAMLEE